MEIYPWNYLWNHTQSSFFKWKKKPPLYLLKTNMMDTEKPFTARFVGGPTIHGSTYNNKKIWEHVRKTVGVVFRHFRAAGVRADEAYTRRMTGEGVIFKERQREWKRQREWQRVSCPECGKKLKKGSLVTHLQTQNGLDKGGLSYYGDEADSGGNQPRT